MKKQNKNKHKKPPVKQTDKQTKKHKLQYLWAYTH